MNLIVRRLPICPPIRAIKFLTTPAAGLEDIYASASYKVSGVNETLDSTQFVVAYHDFSADTGEEVVVASGMLLSGATSWSITLSY